MSFLVGRDLKGIKLRPQQKKCLKSIFNKVDDVEDKTKFFILDLPPGVGKSILAMSFIYHYLKRFPDTQFDMLTETKILQEQYRQEFSSISNLWGKNTYECPSFGVSCDKGARLAALTKSNCDSCPYTRDREQFMRGKISLTNFHMHTVLNINELLNERNADILIVDEAHSLERSVTDYVGMNISEGLFESFGIKENKNILEDFYNLDTVEQYYDNIKKISGVIEDKLLEYNKKLQHHTQGNKTATYRNLALSAALDQESDIIKYYKYVEELNKFIYKVDNFIQDYKENKDNWSLDKIKDTEGNIRITVEPIWVGNFMKSLIWDKYEMVILMSATFLSKEMTCFLNGIESDETVYYSIDSPFPVKNRPIYFMDIGKMSFNQKEKTFEKSSKILQKILNKYKNEKGIIHTTNYELSSWIQNRIINNRLLYHDSTLESKNSVLDIHYNEDNPSVIVSPSMVTGVDLKNERARFQVLMKVPYPSLASNRNKKRMQSNKDWYGWSTVTNIIQAYGRAIRSVDDHANFIILDSCFDDVITYSGKFLPKWVTDAIIIVEKSKIKI